MNYLLGLLLLITLIVLVNHVQNKRRITKWVKKIKADWGKVKEDEHFDFNWIAKYYQNYTLEQDAFHHISDKTAADLDLNEVFKFLDRTTSKIGQQYLYAKIRTLGQQNDLERFEKLTEIITNDEALREACQLELMHLSEPESYDLEELLNRINIEKPKYLNVIKLLGLVNLICIGLSFYNSAFLLPVLPILIVNFIFHFRNKINVQYYLSGIHQLSKSLDVSKSLAKHSAIIKHFPNREFIAEINTIRFKTKFIGFEKKFDNELAFIVTYFFDLIKLTFNIEYILFFSFVESITKKNPAFILLFNFIGEIDASISVASLKSGNLELCQPIFTPEKQIATQNIYHPLIENCVKNTLNLDQKSILITGSNMSGKTTFIRTFALNSLLAQTLYICFADTYKAPYFKLYSSIRIADDITEQKSYYLEEVLTIKELIDATNGDNPCLFVLDEIFKGTNTVERISAGRAILNYLNQKKHLVFVSTHDVELCDLLENEGFELYHFNELIEEDTLIFDHKLKIGRLTQRNAIRILKLYDYPETVIQDATLTVNLISNKK